MTRDEMMQYNWRFNTESSGSGDKEEYSQSVVVETVEEDNKEEVIGVNDEEEEVEADEEESVSDDEESISDVESESSKAMKMVPSVMTAKCSRENTSRMNGLDREGNQNCQRI